MSLPIPTIDVSPGLDHPEVVRQLAQACEEWGFFQIQGHGIGREKRARLFRVMHHFFELTKSEKLALSRTQSNFWGYYDQELTKNRVDQKEIFDIDANLDHLVPEASNAHGVPWPNGLPEFKPAVIDWLHACEELSQSLLGGICMALEQAPDMLNPFFLKDHSSFLRLNHYPAKTPVSAQTAGLGIHPHTDAGALTILAHDTVPGLQVRKNDNWHTVDSLALANRNSDDEGLLVNIGDMMQVWSNDRFTAPEHRVLASGTVPRYSAPYFYNPSYDTICQPLVYPAALRRYQPISWGEFRQGRAAGDYTNLGEEIQITRFRKP